MISNTFSLNTAPYGADIASYPVKVVHNGQDDITIENVGSGVKLDQTIQFELVDYDNQVMVLDDESQIELKTIQDGTFITGTTSEKLYKGIAQLDNLYFESSPGDVNIEYGVTSKSIDDVKISLAYNLTSTITPIFVNFRYCMPGESIENNT